MAKSKVVLKSNFRASKQAGDDAIAELIKDGTDKMHETAAERLDKAAGQRGYSIYSTDLTHETSDDEGTITFPHFWGRFFEFGTPTIQAMPFMRPGYRAGRKHVKTEAPEVFVKWQKRKAQIR